MQAQYLHCYSDDSCSVRAPRLINKDIGQMAEISYIATLCIKTPHETLTEIPKL